MANELTISSSIRFTKSGIDEMKDFRKVFSVSGEGCDKHVQVIGTGEEAVSGVDVSTPGFIFAENLDGTNYVELAATTGDYFCKLKAGEPALFRLTGTTLFAKANTAACKVFFFIIPD